MEILIKIGEKNTSQIIMNKYISPAMTSFIPTQRFKTFHEALLVLFNIKFNIMELLLFWMFAIIKVFIRR